MASVLGFISTVTGGILSDKFRHNKMAKAYICMLSSIVASPALFFCFERQGNFDFSVSMLGVNYLFAEAWSSPAITMLTESIDSQNIAFGISAYLFMTTISGMVATAALGSLQNYLDADKNVAEYGYTLNWFM